MPERRKPTILTPEEVAYLDQNSFPALGEITVEQAAEFVDDLRRFPMVWLNTRYHLTIDGQVHTGDLPIEVVAEQFHQTIKHLLSKGLVRPLSDKALVRMQIRYEEAREKGFGGRAHIEERGYDFQQITSSWNKDLPADMQGNWMRIIERYRVAELVERQWSSHEQA